MATKTGLMTADDYATKADELAEIKMEMEELLSRARKILRTCGMVRQRAEAYWLDHIAGALDKNDGSRSMFTMADTIEELQEAASGGDDNDD